MPEILTTDGEKFFCQPGQTLLEALLAASLFIESPCGGLGKCGKCKIRILNGPVPAPTAEEILCLDSDELAANFRLACALRPQENVRDMTVEIPHGEKGHAILSEGYMPDFTLDPPVNDGRCGLAVDIGTTTVVASLLDLRDGHELGTKSLINPQRNQGLDVLSRITYAQEQGQKGRDVLQRSVVSAIETMALELCDEKNIPAHELCHITVAANTTMLHLFLGVDPRPLGIRPFTPVFTHSKNLRASEIGMTHFANARLTTLPSVSAYIGADIVAGAYVCGMERRNENTLFIDIGTNGEMILARQGKLLACSCAAGPALEGMNISCGMRAAEGAVESVKIQEDGEVRLQVIGDVKPMGICGSGILSAIREMLKFSLIAKNGRLVREGDLSPDDPRRAFCCARDGKPAVRLAENILITQGDVRQVQLAKGAILSGVSALLKKAGLDIKDLNKVLVAGQFGAHLPVESLTGCGLLPELPDAGRAERIAETEAEVEVVEYVGNTSKTGACLALLSKEALKDMERLAREINYIELAEMDGYDRLFAKCMEFPVPAQSPKS